MNSQKSNLKWVGPAFAIKLNCFLKMSSLFKIVFVHHLPVFSATVVNLINATIAYNIFLHVV